MSASVYDWLKAGHLIGDFLWVGSMFVLYWLLRFHTQAPSQAHEKLVLMERSLALAMDVTATLAIGCGIALIFYRLKPEGTIFSEKPAGWFHIKLLVVALGMLGLHGMLRARVKAASTGAPKPMPDWMWTLQLATVVAIVIITFVVRNAMMRG